MDDLSIDDERNIPLWAYETIEIEDPDPDWMDQGIQESKELLQILSAWGVREVEHIGSTAISDLPAKPIIDFMASISSFEDIDGVVGNLSLSDWHYVPPELDKHHWRRFFVKVENDKRVAHLHLMQEGEERWGEQLEFRNRLRADGHLADQYAALKRRIAKEFNHDREKYTEAKTAFINKVLRQ
ncbi:GrpB family protein [Rossellomorea marisflavi]|nr:GrpB family protein [Rossellomorea marisflavi]MDR4936362.1 GrpB family protein [Rossellomorea marisflavi]